ncbi:MAG: steroid 5-alpha reductase family enzyme, partial [Candidatus Azotimanducaceae bacterium]
MDFKISRADKTRTLCLIGANLILILGLTSLTYALGMQNGTINFVDLIFEAASGVVAFLLFA